MTSDSPYSIQSVGGVLCWRTHCDHGGCPGVEWAERERSGPMVRVGCGHPTITSGCPFAFAHARTTRTRRTA